MQRTDRFEAFPEADPDVVGRYIRDLKARADLAIYAAPHLMQEERTQVRRQTLVTHGVDYEVFAAAGRNRASEPADVADPRRPRVGFVGGIDDHTFDPELFLGSAAAADFEFVSVGGCSLPEGWCTLPNVKTARPQALRDGRDLHGGDGRVDHAVERQRLDQGVQSDQAQGIPRGRAARS